MPLQTSYTERIADAVVGQIVSASPKTVNSYVAEIATSEKLPFGRAVKRGTAAQTVLLGVDYDQWNEVGQLDEPLDASETAIDVDDATVFDIGDRIMVGSEEMLVTAVVIAAQDQLTVTRGVNGTAAASADNNAAISRLAAGPPMVSNFLGVATIDFTLPGGISGDENVWKRGDVVSVCSRGIVAVEAETAVSVGDQVTVNADTGKFSNKRVLRASSNAQVLVPGVVWHKAAAASDVGYIRLFGLIN